MSVEGFDIVIPGDEAARKRLRVFVEEAVNCVLQADAQRDHKKEIIAAIKENFQIDASIVNKIIAMRHKQTFTQVELKQEATKQLYTALFGKQEGIDGVNET